MWGLGEDDGGGYCGDAFASASQTKTVGGGGADADGGTGCGCQCGFGLGPSGAKPGFIADDLDADVADGVSGFADTAGSFGEQGTTGGASPLGFSGTKVGAKVADVCRTK